MMKKNAINRYENSWQGFQFWNQTFDAELAKVDIDEIRELLAADIIEPNTKLEK